MTLDELLHDPQALAALKYALRFAESPTPCESCPMFRECVRLGADPWPCEWVPGKLREMIEMVKEQCNE